MVTAFSVIGQHFDNAASRDPAVPAALQHALEFHLQGRKISDFLIYLDKPGFDDAIGLAAGLFRPVLKREERADCGEFEPQFSGVPDEA